MSRSIPMFTLFALLAPMGCDEPEPADVETLPVAAVEAERPGVQIRVGDQARPEQLIAAIEADLETTIYFIKGEPDADGRFPVDVSIVGRSGGFDYGGLFTAEEATPLELFLALTTEEQPIPAELQLAHDWQVERTRPAGEGLRALAIPGPEARSLDEDWWDMDKSTFTCLSWTNFQSYMAGRFLNSPGRAEEVGSAVGNGVIYNPPQASNSWPVSEVDMVACNYETSADPAYNDQIHVDHCYVPGIGGAQTEYCLGALLNDGWYFRRIFNPVDDMNHRYRTYADPVSSTSLQSFSGIVKRDN